MPHGRRRRSATRVDGTFNPRVVGSSPTGPTDVCAGQRTLLARALGALDRPALLRRCWNRPGPRRATEVGRRHFGEPRTCRLPLSEQLPRHVAYALLGRPDSTTNPCGPFHAPSKTVCSGQPDRSLSDTPGRVLDLTRNVQ